MNKITNDNVIFTLLILCIILCIIVLIVFIKKTSKEKTRVVVLQKNKSKSDFFRIATIGVVIIVLVVILIIYYWNYVKYILILITLVIVSYFLFFNKWKFSLPNWPFRKWLKWIIGALVIVSLIFIFWRNPWSWNWISSVKTATSLSVNKNIEYGDIVNLKSGDMRTFRTPINLRFETRSSSGEFEIYEPINKSKYYLKVKNNKVILGNNTPFPINSIVIVHAITDVKDLIITTAPL